MSALPMSWLFSGGRSQSVIKSVQRVVAVIPQGSGLLDIEISNVDVSKTVLNFLGYNGRDAETLYSSSVHIRLAAENVVSVKRLSTISPGEVSFEVVEYQ